MQKKVSNLLSSLHHLVRQITPASLAVIVYQMEKITLACVPGVEEDPTASVSPNTILLLLGIIALRIVKENVYFEKHTYLTLCGAESKRAKKIHEAGSIFFYFSES